MTTVMTPVLVNALTEELVNRSRAGRWRRDRQIKSTESEVRSGQARTGQARTGQDRTGQLIKWSRKKEKKKRKEKFDETTAQSKWSAGCQDMHVVTQM